MSRRNTDNMTAIPMEGTLEDQQQRNRDLGQTADAAQLMEVQQRITRNRQPSQPSSSSPSKNAAPQKKIQCALCLDKFPRKSLVLPTCGHFHCIKCFTYNIHVALTSKPFAPARCCQVIPIELLKESDALTADDIKRYKVCMEELTNPSTTLYCRNCETYIPKDNRGRRAGLCHCGTKTCKRCGEIAHFGICDEAKMQANRQADDEIYGLAESHGWKRCPKCLNLVQKNGGCNHMTCTCGQSFCYLCGAALGTDVHKCEKQQLYDEQQRRRRETAERRRRQQEGEQQQQQQQQPQQQ